MKYKTLNSFKESLEGTSNICTLDLHQHYVIKNALQQYAERNKNGNAAGSPWIPLYQSDIKDRVKDVVKLIIGSDRTAGHNHHCVLSTTPVAPYLT